ncbi:MAG: S-layer homology domain-containing protein [Oscillospiraceae bacterium]|nr:S-layer homology domain-containing protein [Oscillospiraceae bacterium]
MKKLLVIILTILLLVANSYTNSVNAAVDTQFRETIASASGRVYVIKSDGTLWYWGKGTFNDVYGDQSPLRALPTMLMDNVIGVYGDWFSGFAIKSDNSLWAVGSCADGEGGRHEDTDPPIKIMEDVIEVASAFSNWIALKTDGTVWQWSSQDGVVSSRIPRQHMSGIKQISAGISSFYALEYDGTLWGWGENGTGALGVKTEDLYAYPPVMIMEDVIYVYARGSNAFAIKTDGSLWGWGDKDTNLIFGSVIEPHYFTPYPEGGQNRATAIFTPVKLMDNVIAINGSNHFAVIKTDNSLWVWGRNSFGQLGNGTNVYGNTPEKLADDVVSVTAKGDFTIFLKTDGTLWGCGSNVVGELALGVFDRFVHPVPIQIIDNVAMPNTPISFPSSWAQSDINFANSIGIVPSFLNCSFSDYITRAEFCSLAVLVYETVTEEKLAERKSFSDTNNVDVEKMGALGVVDGIGDGLFNPDGNLTREQAAVVLARLADSMGLNLPMGAANYADANDISAWAREFVGQMQAAGIMGGVGENAFSPKGAYTREQAIVTIVRLFNADS